MRERPRYSTGFRIWLGGIAGFVLGLALLSVWQPLAIALVLVGGAAMVWFKFPSDWRRTWPDDFPVISQLVGAPRHSRFSGTVYDETRNAWERASPRRRLLESIFMAALAVGIVVFAAADPGAYFDGFRPRDWLALALAPLLLGLSISRARTAINDRRRGDTPDV